MTDPFNDGEYRDEFEWEKEIRKDDDRVHDYLVELPRYIDLPDEDKVISKRIEQLPEVAMVDVSGCVEPELLIIPDEAALREAGMSLAEFESAIHAADVRLGSLAIRDGEYRYNVKFQSIASTKTDIENISLNCHDRIFKVRDLSQVIEHPAKRSGLVRSDGKDAISLAVIKQSDAKMSSLKSKMSELSEQLEKDYPQIDFKVTRDQTELLEYSINNLLQNIIVGIILACVIIFLFMQDFRSPALVALTIPTALIFSMLVFHVMGMTINMNGTAIEHVIATAFIATAAGLPISTVAYITIMVLAIGSAAGTPAIPNGGTVMLYATMTGAGFSTDLCIMIYIVLMTLNRPIDMTVTALNVVGDAATTCLVSASEGELDRKVFNA